MIKAITGMIIDEQVLFMLYTEMRLGQITHDIGNIVRVLQAAGILRQQQAGRIFVSGSGVVNVQPVGPSAGKFNVKPLITPGVTNKKEGK